VAAQPDPAHEQDELLQEAIALLDGTSYVTPEAQARTSASQPTTILYPATATSCAKEPFSATGPFRRLSFGGQDHDRSLSPPPDLNATRPSNQPVGSIRAELCIEEISRAAQQLLELYHGSSSLRV